MLSPKKKKLTKPYVTKGRKFIVPPVGSGLTDGSMISDHETSDAECEGPASKKRVTFVSDNNHSSPSFDSNTPFRDIIARKLAKKLKKQMSEYEREVIVSDISHEDRQIADQMWSQAEQGVQMLMKKKQNQAATQDKRLENVSRRQLQHNSSIGEESTFRAGDDDSRHATATF